MSWQVELSPAAVRALRALPRNEQRRVAERIRHLEEGGIPPGAPEEGSARLVPAGDQVLVCLLDARDARLVIVTLRPVGTGPGSSLAEFAARRIGAAMEGGWMGSMIQDLRFALRSLRKSPAFATVAILTLALGIGAASAIFSVAQGVLLTPLPYGDSDRVVTVWASWDNFPEKTWLSVPEFQLFHQENRTFQDMALYARGTVNFTSVENPEQVGMARVTPNIFSVLGVEPLVGRVPTWDEARDSLPPVLIGHELWQRRWGGDRSVVGSTVEIDGTLVPVIGVLPPGFVLPVDFASSSVSEVFTPTWVDLDSPAPGVGTGGSHGAYGVARLREGITVAQGRSDLQRVMAQVEPVGLYAPERRFTPRVFAAKDEIVGSARGSILVLLGAVTLVLLIACGNVANLLLARSEVRMREMAVRTAVGAPRGRILRQLLTEAGVLALLGGALGVVIAAVGVDALLSIDPDSVPRSAAVGVNLPVLLFALGTSLLTALLFGAAPALRIVRKGGAPSLHESGRGAGAVSTRMQGVLVACQMAMAVILLTASGLMIRSFVGLLGVDPGFHPEDVLTLSVSVPPARYPGTPEVVEFYEELLRRVREIPGVRAAGAARLLPLATTMGDAGVFVEGYVPAPDESTQGEWQWATPGYLEVMGIPLLAGRIFDERDGMGAPEVIIINESLARHYFGERDPVGARIRVFSEETTVVGVVGDVAHNGLTGSVKERFYRPHAQVDGVGQRSMTLTIATAGDPRSALAPVREVIRRMDPSLPLARIQTMDEVLANSLAQPRFAMLLLAAFAAIAMVLAMVGIYGVLSYAVNRRVQELGIRMALGAGRSRVIRLVVGQGMVMALLGVAAGSGAALALSRVMEGMLYGVAPQDPATFLAVPGLLAIVALAASSLPALRAARMDPAHALRHE